MPWAMQDKFNRADAATLGANWTTKANAPGIFSTAVDVTVISTDNMAFYSGISWPVNHYAQARTVVAGAAARGLAVGVRMTTNTAVRDGYFGGSDFNNKGNSDRCIFKWVSDAWTELGAQAGVAIAAGDLLRLEVTGSLLRLFVNGTLSVSVTDTSLTTAGGGAGLTVFNGTGDVALLNEFEAGDFNYQVGGIVTNQAVNTPRQGAKGIE